MASKDLSFPAGTNRFGPPHLAQPSLKVENPSKFLEMSLMTRITDGRSDMGCIILLGPGGKGFLLTPIQRILRIKHSNFLKKCAFWYFQKSARSSVGGGEEKGAVGISDFLFAFIPIF